MWPTTVISTTLGGPLEWPDATVLSGDAVDVVARLELIEARTLDGQTQELTTGRASTEATWRALLAG